MLKRIPLDLIYGNPNQPRKVFDQQKLRELADNIAENGLHQPITVRPDGNGRYMVIMGERRFRAHQLLAEQGRATDILCHVRKMDDDDLAIAAITENLQRVDISPLEEARAFQAMLDRGFTVEELAKRLGLRQAWRVTERTSLLALRPEYQDLLAKGQLGHSQAFEMSRLSPANQDRLFRMIRAGQCASYNALRAAANGLVEAEQQGEMFSVPKPTDEERATMSRLEAKIEQVSKILAGGFKDNEVVIAKKIAPDRAATMADHIALMVRSLTALEKSLRQSAAQADLVSEAA